MNTMNVLRYGHETVVQAVDGLPQEAWETPHVCGVWSVKEIVAHLASFEQMLIDVLRSLMGETETPTLDRFKAGIQAFNDAEVARRADKSAADVWAEYESAYREAAALMAEIPVEGRRVDGSLPWYGADYSLEDFIVYTFYGHKREHCAQIGVFRERMGV